MRWIAFFIFLTVPAMAQDMPTMGTLSNTKEMSSLQYTCRQSALDTIECDFVQTSVRKKASAEELTGKLIQARAQFKEAKGTVFTPAECDSYRAMSAAFKQPANLPPERKEAMAKMTPKERLFSVDFLNAMVLLCNAPTEENVIKITQMAHAKDEKTCKVSANPFKQSFKRVANSYVWAANDGPSGQCGVINVSRLERAKESTYFYNYVSKKFVSNPNASAIGDMKCSSLDQDEYLYEWKPKIWNPDCDFLEFSY